jgi:hypothetical protein
MCKIRCPEPELDYSYITDSEIQKPEHQVQRLQAPDYSPAWQGSTRTQELQNLT